MKVAWFVGALGLLAGSVRAQDPPAMPQPVKEHRWLQQLVGEWETEAEMMGRKTKGRESVRPVGGFWVVLENEGQTPIGPYKGVMTLGFDAKKGKYIGTWVDSMQGHLWSYEGVLDAAGRVLTLDAQGPCPWDDEQTIRYRESIEIKCADERVFTSKYEKEGQFVTMFTSTSKRKRKEPAAMGNKLVVTAPGDRDIVMTRVFDAPKRLVWDAITKPELVKKWMGVHAGWSWAVCEMDLKVGGKYRYVWRGPDGTEMGMGGVFKEIVPNERLVATEKFDDPWYPGEGLDTTELIEQGGRTTMKMTVRYDSKEARDAVLKSPMESGMVAGYNKLEEILQSLK